GPSGPAVADTPVPTNPPPAPDDPPASTPGEWPEYVRNTDASTHMWSTPHADATDFGPIGKASVTYLVLERETGRYHVRNPVNGNQFWIDIDAVRAAEAPDATPAGTEPATPTRTYVRTLMATARLFSSPYDDAADFGPVGQASLILVVIEGPVNGHLHVYNPTTRNYAWIESRDVAPSGPPTP
ncbi:MAG: hypothetical protein EBU62_12100, partial [Proteobacteria bacterium]|nr:hypothetical protein [Pseudomonadota bacterium]